MLIITRKINDTIQIGENINVKVVKIEGDKVELEVTLDGDIKNEVIKYDEEIQISQDVYIKTNIISLYSIRLGITAPRNMNVIRIPKVSRDNQQ